MTMVNSADLRSHFAEILATVTEEKKPVVVGRFGQPKAVIIDLTTFKLQQMVLDYLSRLDTLNKSEIETLEILIEPASRNALSEGLKDLEKGRFIPTDEL